MLEISRHYKAKYHSPLNYIAKRAEPMEIPSEESAYQREQNLLDAMHDNAALIDKHGNIMVVNSA